MRFFAGNKRKRKITNNGIERTETGVIRRWFHLTRHDMVMASDMRKLPCGCLHSVRLITDSETVCTNYQQINYSREPRV